MVTRRIFKVVLLGDQGVGKATFRLRFLGYGFRRSYGRIIGANFAVKKLTNYLDESIITQIWEIIPQHRFKYMREVYYKGATGGILVFDISRPTTMKNLVVWANEFNKFNNKNHVPLLIVGSKADLRDKSTDAVSRFEAEEFVNQLSIQIHQEITYIETSIEDTEEFEYGFRSFVNNITNNLVFSTERIDKEISFFIERHGKKLKGDLTKHGQDHNEGTLEKLTINLAPTILYKLRLLSQNLGIDENILLNKIIADFFDS